MGKPKTKYHILENEQQLDMLIDACKKTGYASVDFETTGNRIYNNDFYPTILGVCFEPGRAGVIPLGHFDSKFKNPGKQSFRNLEKKLLLTKALLRLHGMLNLICKYFTNMVSFIKVGYLMGCLLNMF